MYTRGSRTARKREWGLSSGLSPAHLRQLLLAWCRALRDESSSHRVRKEGALGQQGTVGGDGQAGVQRGLGSGSSSRLEAGLLLRKRGRWFPDARFLLCFIHMKLHEVDAMLWNF